MKILGCSQAVRHGTLTPAFVGPNPATPAKNLPGRSSRRFLLFHSSPNPLHRSIFPFSALCTDSDSRKGLFCALTKADEFVVGFGLAKAEPDSAKKPPLHKLFTNTFDPSSNCPDLNSRNWANDNPIYFCLATDKNKNNPLLHAIGSFLRMCSCMGAVDSFGLMHRLIH